MTTHPIQQARDDLKPERMRPTEIIIRQWLEANNGKAEWLNPAVALPSGDWEMFPNLKDLEEMYAKAFEAEYGVGWLDGRNSEVEAQEPTALTAQPVTGDAALREALEAVIAKRRACISPKGAETEWGEGWDACAGSFSDELEKSLATVAPTLESLAGVESVFERPVAPQPAQPAWRDISSLTEEDGGVSFLMDDDLVFRGFYHECQGEGDEVTGFYILKFVGEWIKVGTEEVKGWMPLPAAPSKREPA